MGQHAKLGDGMAAIRETDLYLPLKSYLEAQGYEVKAEIASADVVAIRAGDAPVIIELKTGFSLALLHQAVARLSVTDAVYVCVPRPIGRAGYKAMLANIKLCRRLGLGVLTVRLPDGVVEPHCDPVPYAPRKSKPKSTALIREFQARQGDPNLGGTRGRIITAYRQDAVRCAAHLAEHGPTKGAAVAKATGVTRATAIMAANHYGWFERVEKGIYAITQDGLQANPRPKDAE